jgi:uncharacterized protein YuzB (UPF0349 family)
VKITFCENNKGKKKVIKKLEEKYPDIEINIKGCIGKCKTCSKSPIAKIKDEVIIGEDKDDLYAKIVKKISE